MNDKKGRKKCYGVVMALTMSYKSELLFLVIRGRMIGKKQSRKYTKRQLNNHFYRCAADQSWGMLPHMDIIANYFIALNNSSFVEGFNNKVKVLKRRCYGLSNVTRLFQRLMLDLTGFERFNQAMA